MKQLLLLRHGDTQDDSPTGADKDRPLTKRGVEQAAYIRRYLEDNDLVPDLIMSSDAKRTRETVQAMDFDDIGTIYETSLYHAPAMRLFDEVFTTDNNTDRLMLVAHNPGIYELARILAGENDQDFYDGYPTCGLSIFEWDVDDWQDIDQNTTQYLGFITG